MRGVPNVRRQYIIVGQHNFDDPALCAMFDDGEVIRVAVNLYHGITVVSHIELHLARGIDTVQVCSIDCPG